MHNFGIVLNLMILLIGEGLMEGRLEERGLHKMPLVLVVQWLMKLVELLADPELPLGLDVEVVDSFTLAEFNFHY